jgi:23S rRNA pseudouridine2605 synthase
MGERSVLELTGNFTQRLHPAGRLDKDSEGLIVLTNDGELTERITHPRYGITKTYKVTVGGKLSNEQVRALTAPVWTSDGKMRLSEIEVITRSERRSELKVVISEGKNREIRRVLAAKGIKVRRLIRTAIGPITAKGLKQGEYRRLSKKEIEILTRGG